MPVGGEAPSAGAVPVRHFKELQVPCGATVGQARALAAADMGADAAALSWWLVLEPAQPQLQPQAGAAAGAAGGSGAGGTSGVAPVHPVVRALAADADPTTDTPLASLLATGMGGSGVPAPAPPATADAAAAGGNSSAVSGGGGGAGGAWPGAASAGPAPPSPAAATIITLAVRFDDVAAGVGPGVSSGELAAAARARLSDGSLPLHHAARFGAPAAVLQRLLDAHPGSVRDTGARGGRTPLAESVMFAAQLPALAALLRAWFLLEI